MKKKYIAPSMLTVKLQHIQPLASSVWSESFDVKWGGVDEEGIVVPEAKTYNEQDIWDNTWGE